MRESWVICSGNVTPVIIQIRSVKISKFKNHREWALTKGAANQSEKYNKTLHINQLLARNWILAHQIANLYFNRLKIAVWYLRIFVWFQLNWFDLEKLSAIFVIELCFIFTSAPGDKTVFNVIMFCCRSLERRQNSQTRRAKSAVLGRKKLQPFHFRSRDFLVEIIAKLVKHNFLVVVSFPGKWVSAD